MKQCPVCKRTYTDETLTYCLDDGAFLSTLYAPGATQRIPTPRATNQASTEAFPYAPSYSQPLKQGRNPWLILTLIALLFIVGGGGILLWLKSGSSNSPSQDSSANPNQSDISRSNENKSESVTKNATPSKPSNTRADDDNASPSPSGNMSPSSQLVGVWHANVAELGQNYEVTFRANTDGTYQYSARNAKGQTINDGGTWQYSDGILYQRFSNGASGKGSIEWIDRDTFELTIIDNGVPAYSGLKRRYRRTG